MSRPPLTPEELKRIHESKKRSQFMARLREYWQRKAIELDKRWVA